MIAVCKREFRALLQNLTGFLFLAVYFLVLGILVTVFNLTGDKSTAFHHQTSHMALCLGILLPLLTARMFAEERRDGSEQLLYILPLRPVDIVLGKYLAHLGILGIATLGTALFPVILAIFGKVNLGAAYLSVLALFVLGAALLAICTFFSSFSKNYALCALFSFLPIAALFLLTLLGVVLPSPFKEAVNAAALFLRFDHFAMGMFDLGAILYALSLTVFFLVLAVLRLRRRQNA